MSQLSLDFSQSAQLDRVTLRIGDYVLAFFGTLTIGEEFTAQQLRDYIGAKTNEYIAPGSPDRVMRSLRSTSRLNYEVVSRSKSLYRKIEVRAS